VQQADLLQLCKHILASHVHRETPEAHECYGECFFTKRSFTNYKDLLSLVISVKDYLKVTTKRNEVKYIH
jgi:hypothetical protein